MTHLEPEGRPPTVREGPSGRPPTVREGGSGRPPTVREGAVVSDGEGPGGWVPVPRSLAARFRYVRSLPGGGEASLHVVSDLHGNDTEVLLKLYNRDIVLREDALAAIAELGRTDPEHVVRLIAWGVVAETGHWYEVQEYLPAGDLSRWIETVGEVHQGRRRLAPGSELLRDVVAELHRAIALFHRAGLSHHDIKPTNVLVRSTQPSLRLALGDFGLSIASDRTVFLSRRVGTCAYDSPESLGAGQGGPKRDFWAMGMTIAELAGGRHPFSRPSDPAGLLPDEAIRHHLYQRLPIDLSAVADPRVRRLCEGLTRYDESHRWGAAEIEAWLGGSDPDVVPDDPPTTRSLVRGIEFAGKVHVTRAELAAALAADWRAAVAVLGTTERRRAFIDEISATFGSGGLDAIEAEWDDGAPKVDRVVTDVITTLDPVGAPPVVKGWSVALDHLAPLARSAVGGDRRALEVVGILYNQRCLVAVARLPGHEPLAGLDRRWHAAVSRYEQLVAGARRSGIDVPTGGTAATRATLLGALADPELAQFLVRDRDEALARHANALRQDWFRPLAEAGADDIPAVLAARALAEPAALQARQAEGQRREQRRAQVQQWFGRVRLGRVTVPAAGDRSPLGLLRWLGIAAGLLAPCVAVAHHQVAASVRESAEEDGGFMMAGLNILLNGGGLAVLVPLVAYAAVVTLVVVAVRTNGFSVGGQGDFVALAAAVLTVLAAALPLVLSVAFIALAWVAAVAVVVGVVVAVVWGAWAMCEEC